ncbi:unnamed protein product, partial [Closterium sp. NIES-54]
SPTFGRFTSDTSGWLLVDKERYSLDGSECSKVGTSFSAFRFEPDRCQRSVGSCLSNQLLDFAQPNGSLSIALVVTQRLNSLITLEIAADDVTFIKNRSPGRIVSVAAPLFEAMSSEGRVDIRIANSGSLDADFTLTVCSHIRRYQCTAHICVESKRAGLLPSIVPHLPSLPFPPLLLEACLVVMCSHSVSSPFATVHTVLSSVVRRLFQDFGAKRRHRNHHFRSLRCSRWLLYRVMSCSHHLGSLPSLWHAPPRPCPPFLTPSIAQYAPISSPPTLCPSPSSPSSHHPGTPLSLWCASPRPCPPVHPPSHVPSPLPPALITLALLHRSGVLLPALALPFSLLHSALKALPPPPAASPSLLPTDPSAAGEGGPQGNGVRERHGSGAVWATPGGGYEEGMGKGKKGKKGRKEKGKGKMEEGDEEVEEEGMEDGGEGSGGEMRGRRNMACIGAESACVDVDALFSSCWEQNDSLTRLVCSMIATPRLAVFNWIRPCKQAAVEVQSVSAVPVVALLEETASADAELETVAVAVAVAVTVDASTMTADVSTQAEKAEEADEAKKSVEQKKKATSFLELLAQEDSVASRTSSVDSVAKIAASSAKVAAWLGVDTGSEQDGLTESETQQGGKVGAEVRSGWCSLSRSCSSRSACLIHLSSDSYSSSAGSLCSSPTGLAKEVAGLKRGIGRGVSSTGKGCGISTLCSSSSADHSGLTPAGLPLAAENNSVKRGIIKGVSSSGKGWRTEVKGTTLAALGFAPSSTDTPLFLRTNTTLPPLYVLVYVDNLVFTTADTEALALVKAELLERHTCTDLGELRSYLGLQITRDRARRTITLTQSHMVHQVLQRFGFQFSSPQPTPQSTGHSLSAPPSDESVEPSGPYTELVGCLMGQKEDADEEHDDHYEQRKQARQDETQANDALYKRLSAQRKEKEHAMGSLAVTVATNGEVVDSRLNEKRSPLHSASRTTTASSSTPSASTSSSRVSSSSASSSSASSSSASSSYASSSRVSSSSSSSSSASSASVSSSTVSSSSASSSSASSVSASSSSASSPRVSSSSSLTPAPVPPAPGSPAPGSPAPTPPTPPAPAAPVPLVRAPPGPAAPAPPVTPRLKAPAPPAPRPQAAEPPAPVAPFRRRVR